uniref:COPA/B TPR domain-containing protein n=1 Tax=Chromera velia CCMP2878 TaxID=1169474 RepID=A0A0G4HJX8_9ALVE|eukprot:Cvel_28281.t1-p1 / transcript=Cvel_28281.t1 / gene=Cvel_28281 / organism=Chromera_velia_CCMP2878 / gene_product=Coatomer subunit beta', putative / transcript_product=Coatomer subunit beta', putative / location=Cvel_scaffold3666:8795-12447(+) / protein_length=155 / sequence_SO=supercontig / SO=protein_coding / is_pseudo=false
MMSQWNPKDPHIFASASLDRWKQLGDVALEHGHFSVAVGCFQEANDLSGLLLVSTAIGDAKLLSRVAEQAAAAKKANVAILAKLLLQDLKGCVDDLGHEESLKKKKLNSQARARARTSSSVGPKGKTKVKKIKGLGKGSSRSLPTSRQSGVVERG